MDRPPPPDMIFSLLTLLLSSGLEGVRTNVPRVHSQISCSRVIANRRRTCLSFGSGGGGRADAAS